MYCLKCGKDTKKEQVFCESCLKGMLPYPVKPDAAVNLPHREPVAVKKQTGRKRPQAPEEQVVQLRKAVRRLWVAAILLFLLLALAVCLLVQANMSAAKKADLGTNYTIDTTLDS